MKNRDHDDLTTSLMKYLFEYKTATIRQIHRDIFPKFKRNAVRMRLVRLLNKKLITPVQFLLDSKEKVYSLSRKGFKHYVGEETVETKEILSSAVRHDTDLVDIGEKLKKCSAVEHYFTENVIKNRCGNVSSDVTTAMKEISPDAMVEAKFDSDPLLLAVEYEATIKSTRRYQNLFQAYYLAPKISGVLYICRTPRMIRKLIQIEKEILPCHHSKFFYTTLHDLLNSPKPSFISLEESVLFLEKQIVE